MERRLRVVAAAALAFALVLLYTPSAARLVRQWWTEPNYSHGRAYLALDALRYRRTDAALVRGISIVRGDEARAEHDAVDFARAVIPILSRHVPGSPT